MTVNHDVVGSSPTAGVQFRPVGQAVKTPPFHGGNTGSSPVRVISFSEDYPSPAEGNGLENRQVCKSTQGFESLILLNNIAEWSS